MKKILIILFVIISCVIFILQNKYAVILKGLTTKALNKIVGTKAEIDSMGLNLLTGGASFSGVKIQNPAGFSEKPFLAIKQGYIKIALLPLLSKKIELKEIFLNEPVVNIEINGAAKSNISLIFEKEALKTRGAEAAPSVKQAPPLPQAKRLVIRNGAFTLVNRKINPNGASAAFDKIDLTVINMIPPRTANEMPTKVNGRARLPAPDRIGNIVFNASGAFLSGRIDFDLELDADNISLPYFMPFYAASSPVVASQGYFDLKAAATCRNGGLDATQKVNISELVIEQTGAAAADNTAFGLPVQTVIAFFADSQGKLTFEFKITGSLTNPQFHMQEAIQKVLAKSIQNMLLNNLSSLPGKIIQGSGETDNADDASKRLIKDIFKKILTPKDQ